MRAVIVAVAATTWHADWKSAFDDVRTLVVDLGTMVVTALGIVLVIANAPRIWAAATGAALTLNIPLIGNITLPARAAAQMQLDRPPPDAGLPPPKPGPIGHGTAPSHLVAAADVLKITAGVSSLQSSQQPAALATQLLATPATLAALTVHSPQEIAFYRKFYSALFASQFDLLESLNGPHDVTVGDAQSRYRASRAFGQPLSFAQWLDYPRRYGMIEPVDPKNPTAVVPITARGQDFLDWAAAERYGSGDLKAAGRTA